MGMGSSRFTAFLPLCLLYLALGRPVQAQPEANRIDLQTSDGKQIAGFWYDGGKPATAPAVILIHNPGATHTGWAPLLGPLQDAGFRILSVDLRGHGDSRETTPEAYEAMRRRDPQPYKDMIHDIEAAIGWLTTTQELAPEHIALVGCEYTADLAILAAVHHPKLRAVVALSPSENYFSFPLVATVRKYGKRPLYFILPKQLYAEGAEQVEKAMKDNPDFTMKVFPRYDHHGVYMLGLNWNVEGLITKWLSSVFAKSAG